MAIHLWPSVARRLLRPTRGLGSAPLPRRRSPVRGLRPPIWPCSRWSLPVSLRRPACASDGIVTVALVLALRRAGVTRHPALRSSDFPHDDEVSPAGARPSDRLADNSVYPTRPESPRSRRGRRNRPHHNARPGPGPYGSGRITTTAVPPAATLSIAWLARASATEFWARGTCAALHRSNPARVCRQAVQSGISFASLTRQRPVSCSTMSFESSSSSTSRAPSSRASRSARSVPVYSATLLVWMPRYSEIDASGWARGSRASGRRRSYSAAPSEAGPGLPRAAPSVRIRNPGRRSAPTGGASSSGNSGSLRPLAPRSPR